jgi:tetrahydromethanopterin S-methyltransferase subunit C
LAAVALSAGALANAGLKLVCALVIGSGAFRRVAALGLLALTLGTGGALALFHAER